MARISKMLDKMGATGALIAAIAAPCCFPIFAAGAAALGFGVLGRYEQIVLYVFQAFVVLSLIGLIAAAFSHRRFAPLALGLAAAALLGYSLHVSYSAAAMNAGLAGLLAATIWNWFSSRRQSTPVLLSIIRCPNCGHSTEETMPTNACLFFYDCSACQARLKPKPGDCCVFCSFGSVPCPPIQLGQSCCA